MAIGSLKVLPLVSVLALSACATGEIDVATPTGRAEAIYDKTTSATLGSKFAEACLSGGFLVEDQQPTSVSCSQSLAGMPAFAVYTVLSANTDDPRLVIRFQLVQSGDNVHVLARVFAQANARFGGGVRSSELTDIASINRAQGILTRAGGRAPNFPFAGQQTSDQP